MVVSQHAPYAEKILTKISATFSSNPVSAVEVMFQFYMDAETLVCEDCKGVREVLSD